jgi:uncharacterized protein with ATP-grasp and redox domains
MSYRDDLLPRVRELRDVAREASKMARQVSAAVVADALDRAIEGDETAWGEKVAEVAKSVGVAPTRG